ncbi:MAG: GNAT family N-acetyltransferase [Verrucomicrobia bacterium]|nr:GNAT family N-acetyltransferase [Verrucomicrobiota bacterium]
METLEFRAVTLANLDAVSELRVRPEQADLVADNLYSIAQAGLDPVGWCRAAYLGDQPIGFFLVRELAEGRHAYLCRFMVDQSWQGRGLGRRMLDQLLARLFASPQLQFIDLAVSRAPRGAEAFYRAAGFVPTEEAYRGGWRMVLRREDYRG